MIEKYVKIEQYPGYYISSLGNVKNSAGKLLKPQKHRDGYIEYCLYKNSKGYRVKAHRLVAMAFIPNPENLPQVNHIDENKENNYVNNLEWCTARYNMLYGTRIKRMMNNQGYKNKRGSSRRIGVYNKENNTTTTFNSLKECGISTGISVKQIRNIISGRTKHTYKFTSYVFYYIKEEKKL